MGICSERIRRGSWDSERTEFVMVLIGHAGLPGSTFGNAALASPTLPGVTCHPSAGAKSRSLSTVAIQQTDTHFSNRIAGECSLQPRPFSMTASSDTCICGQASRIVHQRCRSINDRLDIATRLGWPARKAHWVRPNPTAQGDQSQRQRGSSSTLPKCFVSRQ
jgi:hypothetical protein